MTIAGAGTRPTPTRRRPDALSSAEELWSVAAGAWMVIGLFFDGLAHVELEPESFFTPSHLILYTGFALASAMGIRPVLRRHLPGEPWGRALPEGHGLTLLGIGIFGVAAGLDLLWHETIGIEVSNEALVSPTHLLLLTGGLLALSGPLRSGAEHLTEVTPRPAWWPATGSLALVASVAIFFTSYLSPFGREAAPSFPATTTHTHELSEATVAAFTQLREAWGLAGILVMTAILTVALLALVRRAIPPRGVITALFAWLALASPAIGGFTQWFAALAVAAGGAVTDAAARRWSSRPLLAAALITPTWTAYFAALAAAGDLAWSPALWSGSIVLATLVALTLGWLTSPRPPAGGSPDAVAVESG